MKDDTSADAGLADMLGALSSPTRIALMRALRAPKTLGEIEVRVKEGGSPIARQTVRQHLDRLLQGGLVVPRETEREHGPTTEYVLSHGVVYALSEDVRTLARIRPAVEIDQDTMHGPHEGGGRAKGPCLVVVKGLEDGVTFPLGPDRDSWRLGRSRLCDIGLDFDPFVSAENAVVHRRPDGFVVEDIEGSLNGTRVNFQQIPRGGSAELRHGDVIGVGRSLLLHWQ